MGKYSNRLVSWTFALSALSLVTPTAVIAEVPSVMSFQAILLDDQGQIVPDSSYDIVFTIHPDSVSFPPDIAIWTELKTVETSGGLFNTMLGTNSPLTAEVFDGERWLQMRLTSSVDPFLPRTRIGTTPYSYRVQSIDKSTGGEVSGTLNPDALQVGRSGVPGQLSVIQGSGIEGVAIQDYLGYGLSLTARDDAGNTYAQIRPDQDGDGGYLSLMRSEFNVGFRVDGNKLGTNDPEVRILGSSQSIDFDLGATGSETVELPVNAIEASEIKDEPGIASDISTSTVTLTNETATTISSRTIDCPNLGGYVYASATVCLTVQHGTGNLDSVTIGLYENPGDMSAILTTPPLVIPGGASWGDYASIVTVTGVFDADTMGTSVFLVARRSGASTVKIAKRTLTLMYLPTAYGIVETSSNQTAGETNQVLTPAEERLASQRANSERIEREMADMKARLLELEQSMTEQESDNPQR